MADNRNQSALSGKLFHFLQQVFCLDIAAFGGLGQVLFRHHGVLLDADFIVVHASEIIRRDGVTFLGGAFEPVPCRIVILFGAAQTVVTVSYTHLDVYKRQPENGSRTTDGTGRVRQ